MEVHSAGAQRRPLVRDPRLQVPQAALPGLLGAPRHLGQGQQPGVDHVLGGGQATQVLVPHGALHPGHTCLGHPGDRGRVVVVEGGHAAGAPAGPGGPEHVGRGPLGEVGVLRQGDNDLPAAVGHVPGHGRGVVGAPDLHVGTLRQGGAGGGLVPHHRGQGPS